MAATVLEVGLSNLVVAAALAVLALAAGKWGRRPALTHSLWLLVLLKLVTPPVVDLPVRLLPAEPVAPAPVLVAGQPRGADLPRPPAAGPTLPAAPTPAAAEPPSEPAAQRQPAVSAPPPRKFNEFRNPESTPVTTAAGMEKAPPKAPEPNAPPAPALPLFPLDPVADVPPAPAGPASEAGVAAPRSGEEGVLTQSVGASGSGADAAGAPEPAPARAPFPWPQVLLAGWLAGGLVWVALVASRVRRFTRVLRLADDAPAWFAREVADVARSLGLAVPPIRLIPGAVAPMVWSLGRTAVYFPADLLARLSPDQRASLIAHELAHLKRGDHWVRWLELAALSVYWWCPLAWLARRELQRAEEECCDAWVVATLPAAGRTYATALLDTLDFLAEAPRAPALASGMGAAAAVKRRLLLILDGRTPQRLPLVGRVMVVLTALLLLPVAPKLARLAGATAPVEVVAEAKPKDAPKPEAGAGQPVEPKDGSGGLTSPGTPVVTNPRGEPLLYENRSTEIRARGERFWSVAVSPDGKTIVTTRGMRDSKGEVLVWDRETGQVKHTVPFPDGVHGAAYSPDGKILATVCYDGGLRFHDPETMAVWAIGDAAGTGPAGTRPGMNGLCFFKGGKYVATAGLLNRTVQIWDVEAVKVKRAAGDPVQFPPVAIFEGHEQRVLAVAASDDGRTIISGSTDQTARLWDLPDPLPRMGEKPAVVKAARAVLRGHQNEIEAVAASPDGTTFATGSWDAQVFTWDRDGKRTEPSGAFRFPVLCLAFSRDGKHLAAGGGAMGAGGQPGEVRVWDMVAKQEVAYRTDYPDSVYSVAFAPDSKTLVAAGNDGAVHLWSWSDKATRTLTRPGLAVPAQPLLAATLSPSGDLLAFAGDSKSVYVWNRREGKLVADLTGHADVVVALAFSPDGQTLATASYDKTVKLWDAATWKERKALAGHTGWVLGVAFSPDGQTVATGSYDKTVRLWDTGTGEPKGTWKDHSAGVRSVAYSPDGKFLASGGSDRIVRVWDVAEGRVVQQLKGHKAAVRAVAFSPDGKAVATGAEDRTVKLWDPATGKELRSFSNLPDMVTALRYSPKGQTLVAATFGGAVALLDPVTGRRRMSLNGHNDAVTGAVFADDGQQLITVSQDRTIRQWPAVKPANVTAAQVLGGPPRLVDALAASPDGRAAVLAGPGPALTLWDLRTGEASALFHTPPLPDGIAQLAVSADGLVAAVGRAGKFWVVPIAMGRDTSWTGSGRYAAFTPDGKHLAVADGRDVVLYEATSGKEVRRFAAGHDGPVVCVAFTPDGKLMASAGEDTKVRLWDVAAGNKRQVSPPLQNYTAVVQMAFTADGARLAVASNSPEGPPPDDMGNFQRVRGVYVLPVPTGMGDAWPVNLQPLQFPDPVEVSGVAWTPDGRGLVTTGTDGLVRLWEPDQRQVAQSFRAHEAAITAVAVTPQAGAFVTAGEDMAVKRWRLPGVELPPGVTRLTPPGLGRVNEVLPSPDGRYTVVAGGGDKAFRVYTTPPGQTAALSGGFLSVFAIAYSPDGRLMATGHDQGGLILWDAKTGQQFAKLEGHTKRVWGLAFTADGSLVSTSGIFERPTEVGEAFVWDVPARKVRKKLEGHAGGLYAVAVTPDGKRVAAGCSDGTVRVWDADTGELVRTLEKHEKGTRTVAFSPDGTKLASGGYDFVVRVWDTETWSQVREFRPPDSRPSRVLFSPDGKEVVVGTRPNTPSRDPNDPENAVIYVFSVDNPDRAPRELKGHTGAVLNMAFLGDKGTLVSVGGKTQEYGEVRAWDFAAGKPIGEFRGHRQWIETVAVAPDGRTIATGSGVANRGGEIRVWDAGGFRPAATVAPPAGSGDLTSGAISPDGKLLVLGGSQKSASVWDMTDPARPVLKARLPGHAGGVQSASFSRDGKRFVTADNAGTVQVWDAATLEAVASFKASERAVYRAKFTPDGKSVVTGSNGWPAAAPSELRVWDAATGKETGRFPDLPRGVLDFVFLDGGKVLLTTHGNDGGPPQPRLRAWDFATRKPMPLPAPVGAIAFARGLDLSPDGKHLAVGASDGPVRVFDVTSWQELVTVPELKKVSGRVAFSPDGKTLAVANDESGAVLIRLPQK